MQWISRRSWWTTSFRPYRALDGKLRQGAECAKDRARNQTGKAGSRDGEEVIASSVMAKLIGLSGSLRRGSFNTARAPRRGWDDARRGPSCRSTRSAGFRSTTADAEAAEGIPQTVAELKEAIAASDGLLLATPEYNNSIPGVLKERDRLADPTAGRHQVGCSAASRWRRWVPPPAVSERSLSQDAWLPVLRDARNKTVVRWKGRWSLRRKCVRPVLRDHRRQRCLNNSSNSFTGSPSLSASLKPTIPQPFSVPWPGG